MKITLSGAMRARDVSRPRSEHFTAAAAREDAVSPQAAPAPAAREGGKGTLGAKGAEQEPRTRRRRRRAR